jgi:hypothetical protein
MIIKVYDSQNSEIWGYGTENGIPSGRTSKSYLNDGTQEKIIECLQIALRQAEGELSFQNFDGMANSGTSTANVKDNIPPS